MFGLGLSEIIVLGVLALVLIGPEQLPELARNLARFINDLKRNTESLTDDIKNQVKIEPIKFDELNKPLSEKAVNPEKPTEKTEVTDNPPTEKKDHEG